MKTNGEKLLIIHMDDMGMSYAANAAGMELFEKGIATSASVMTPCPWAHDFIKWHVENPRYDVGVHLTHTCEWDSCRWRALSSRNEAPEMYDEDGFMWRGFDGEMKKVPIKQVELESRKQIELALKWGMKPSHIDTHMCTVTGTTELFGMYLYLADEYRLVPHIHEWSLFDEERVRIFNKHKFPRVDSGISSGESENYVTKKTSFFKILKEMKPGLNVLTVHPIIDTPEIRAIIPSWEERHLEYRLLLDNKVGDFIKEQGIRLVTWGEINKLTMDN